MVPEPQRAAAPGRPSLRLGERNGRNNAQISLLHWIFPTYAHEPISKFPKTKICEEDVYPSYPEWRMSLEIDKLKLKYGHAAGDFAARL